MQSVARPDNLMAALTYLHLPVGQTPPDEQLRPFRAVLISEEVAPEEWRRAVCEWLVRSGCLYFVAWGTDCEQWHDGVDFANLDAFDYGEIPEDDSVMTTWHENEPLGEAFWYAEHCAFHPTVELSRTLIIDVSSNAREDEILKAYQQARDSDPSEN